VARTDPQAAQPRTQSSLAISADGRHWFLLNASPDVREQIRRLPAPGTPSTVRHVPFEAVLLTDAELDHTLGIALLREARVLPIYMTGAIRSVLEQDSRILPLVRSFADVPVTELALETPVALRHRDGSLSGLVVEAFEVPAGPPKFATNARRGHTVGLCVRDDRSGRICAYVPGCGGLPPALRERLAAADVLLFDGTFWTDEEPRATGISTRRATEMDHMPISGPDGSLAFLSKLSSAYRVYTHINNTNPILLEGSPEHAEVVAAGVTVGIDGLSLSTEFPVVS
jgi:pyrroloquinoline quinone biosynthesis protein B